MLTLSTDTSKISKYLLQVHSKGNKMTSFSDVLMPLFETSSKILSINVFSVDSEYSFLCKSEAFEVQKQITELFWKCFHEAVFGINKRHKVNLRLRRFEWTSLWLQPCFEDIWKIPAENIPDWVQFFKCFSNVRKIALHLFCFSCKFSKNVLNSPQTSKMEGFATIVNS